MLNFIYYPVSAILWFWWKAFGYLFGAASGITWALAVVFLIFTLRAILFKPFVHQVRSMRKMQEFAPEIQKLKKKYPNDKQKLTQEMQKLQSEHGVNPLGGCLPVLIQVPVFIGLFHVLREFQPWKGENYVFGRDGVVAFNDASLFGAKLGAWVTMGQEQLEQVYDTSVGQMLVVMIPLMIAAGIFTHITARHSVARQTEAQAATSQSAIMNKLMLYVFPIGVVVGAPFLPLAILIYWVANNLWTLGQQWLVYRQIGREEEAKAVQAAADRQARAPRPGQKPARSRPRSDGTPADPGSDDSAGGAGANGAERQAAPSNGRVDGRSNGAGTAKPAAAGRPKAGGPDSPAETDAGKAASTASRGGAAKGAGAAKAGGAAKGAGAAKGSGAAKGGGAAKGAGQPGGPKPAGPAGGPQAGEQPAVPTDGQQGADTGPATAAAKPAGATAKSGPAPKPSTVRRRRKRR